MTLRQESQPVQESTGISTVDCHTASVSDILGWVVEPSIGSSAKVGRSMGVPRTVMPSPLEYLETGTALMGLSIGVSMGKGGPAPTRPSALGPYSWHFARFNFNPAARVASCKDAR